MRLRLLLITLALVPAVPIPQTAWATSNAGTNAKIVFARDTGAGNHDVFVANADGSGAVDLTNDTSDDVDPTVSPDGTRVAFSSNRGGSYDLFVMNIDGSVPIRITASFGAEREPVWTPDGNEIAYAALPVGGATGWDIWTVGADGSDPTAKASLPGDDHHPTYSPDGTQVAWSSGGQIYASPSDFSLATQIIASGTVDTSPTWSPDSTRLAWNCSHAICVDNANGYSFGPVTGGIPGLASVAWSPDGAYVLYNDNSGVKRVDVDGSNVTTLTSTPGDFAADWAPGLANVRAPLVAGTFEIGSTLVADTGVWVGSSPVTYAYQWMRCSRLGGTGCLAIPGATAQYYTTIVTDLNATLRVFVTATSPAGPPHPTAASAPTATITNPVGVGLPAIVSTLDIGSTALATPGDVGSGLGTAPLNYTFVWERCDSLGNTCSPIAGATAPSYVITSLDSGHTLRVVVTATNANGSATGTSLATEVIGGLLPVNTTAPVIAGTPVIGATLVATSGVWAGAGLAFSYQWKRCAPGGANCLPIAGATATSYTTVADDAGSTVVVTVTAANSYGFSPMDSLPTVIVGATPRIPGPGMPASTVAPHAVGTPAVGSALTATTGGFVGVGNTYAFQWQRCDTQGVDCESIPGATSASYTLRMPDLGSTIRVVVTARNSVGSASAYSDVSSVVAAAPAGGASGNAQSFKALVLKGTAHADRLVIRKGKNRIVAGAGNDTIFAADGRREVIDCGAGRDTVTADRIDVLLHCERVIYPKKRLAATK
jgi:hypothetical protein